MSVVPSRPISSPLQKRPRVKENKHLDFIRGLPCLVCGTKGIQAAHIRYGSLKHGKRPTGMGEKPSDCYTVPLCPKCHREQHSMNEDRFWKTQEIDPLAVAADLYCVSGDQENGELIIRYGRK